MTNTHATTWFEIYVADFNRAKQFYDAILTFIFLPRISSSAL